MLKRNNRKGFTLAELLIVVAIIAVLIAVAVPLFVGGVDKAQEATYKANERAVKVAAIAGILSSNTDMETIFAADNVVYASAKVDPKTGKMEELNVVYGKSTDTNVKAAADAVTATYDEWTGEDKGGANKITVQITKTDAVELEAGTPAGPGA